jgi:hypothetical protein
MPVLRTISLLLLALAFAGATRAQQLSQFRMKMVPVQVDTLQLDSLSLLPNSLMLWNGDVRLDTGAYTIDPVSAKLTWKQAPAADSVQAIFRVIPLKLDATRQNKDITNLAQNENFLLDPFNYNPNAKGTTGVVDFGNLDYNGSFSRGLSVGNNQSVVLTSSFNLQLQGSLGQGIEVVAALTDNNVPVQPEGNTQTLQEFDRVFIQITKKPHKLIVGDYEVGNPPGHFMKFYRNLQGGQYSGQFSLTDSISIKTQTSLALAKGRFSRNQLPVTEGNQGPYKLTGANGETFIIVMAGTERVFVNGKQLVRGSGNDYVIDYNLGEITFTPNTIITEDLRVIVEFEYSEQNYFRTFVHTYNEVSVTDKLKLRLNFINEADNRNQAVQADLSQEQKQFLADIGDDLSQAQYPGYKPVAFEPNRILYELTDTVINGIVYDSVFVASVSQEVQLYSVSFAFVGTNSGNYRPANATANGRIFEWIPPVNGVAQGSYEPVIVLVTPKRRQMTTLGLDWAPTATDTFILEGAMNNDDLNTFSKKDQGDNIGVATLAGYKRKINFGAPKTVGVFAADSSLVRMEKQQRWFMLAGATYEFVNRNFNPLDRYRPVEFTRNWNLTGQDSSKTDQHLANGGVILVLNQHGSVGYDLSYYQVTGGVYEGYMHNITSRYDNKGYKLNFRMSLLNAQGSTQDSRFVRPLLTAEKTFFKLKGWRVGGYYEHDNNKRYASGTNSLLASSFVWTDWRVYVANSVSDTAKYHTKLEYIRRLEWRPETTGDALNLYSASNTWNWTGDWTSNPMHNLSWQATYRRFEDRRSTTQELEEFYLGRVQYGLTVLKGAIVTNVLYELGAGQEQRRDFTYLPVPAGEGSYIWNDYNGNGIQEENEFEIATFTNDTMYIRVANPTNEFDPVNITVFNQALNLTPGNVWRGKKGIKGFVAKFNSLTSLQLDRRVFRGANISPFNPFVFDIDETALVALNANVRNSIFFNRTDTKYNLEYTIQDNRSKLNLSTGFDVRTIREHLFRVRSNFVKDFTAIAKATFGNRGGRSGNFADRNYDIRYYTAEPELIYLFKAKFRISLQYVYGRGQNELAGGAGEKTQNQQITIDSRYSIVTKSSISAKFTYAAVQYTGTENSAIEFAMLQGLKAGNNFLWTLGFDRTLAKNIQLNLSYEGRKTGEAKMVHIGRAQIRAIF